MIINMKKNACIYLIGGLLFTCLMEFVVFKGLGNNENYAHLLLWGPLTNYSTLPIQDYLVKNCPGNSGLKILSLYFFLMGGFLSIGLSILIAFLRKDTFPGSFKNNAIFCGLSFLLLFLMIVFLNSPSIQEYNERSNGQMLFSAIYARSYSKVEELLKKGVNINCRERDYHDTPLTAAIRQNDIEMVKLLLKYKADPDEHVKGNCPPLFLAADKIEILKLLVDNHANLNAQSSYGENVLYQCFTTDSIDKTETKVKMIEYLGQKGINPNLRNPVSLANNETVLDFGLQKGRKTDPRIITALRKIGAKTSGEIKMETPVDKLALYSVFIVKVDEIIDRPEQINGHWYGHWIMKGTVVKILKPSFQIGLGSKVELFIGKGAIENYFDEPVEKLRGKTYWVGLQNEYSPDYHGKIEIYPNDKK